MKEDEKVARKHLRRGTGWPISADLKTHISWSGNRRRNSVGGFLVSDGRIRSRKRKKLPIAKNILQKNSLFHLKSSTLFDVVIILIAINVCFTQDVTT